MKKVLLFFFCFIQFNTFAQTTFKIKGTIYNAKDREIQLMGFEGTKDLLLFKTKTDSLGNFIINYPKNYIGAASLQVKELTNLIVLLNQENFSFTWTDCKNFNSLQFTNSKENDWFHQAFKINLEVQKRLVGLNYLLPLYQNEVLKKEWLSELEKEIRTENTRFNLFLQQLPTSSYASSYLYYRAILQNLQGESKSQQAQVVAENSFLELKFNDKNLYHSGLIKEFFDQYLKQTIKLQNKEEILSKLNSLSEKIKKSTTDSPLLLNVYSEYLIQHYEQFGLSEAAEKLGLSLLNDNQCRIDNQRLPLLEQYRKMAVGNDAPALSLTNHPKYKSVKDLKSNYKVVVFGASWCEECVKEIPQFKEYYETFKTKYQAELIFVSIDSNKEKYDEFKKDLPFINSCDFKGWEGENVKNWYVFASPTIYILNDQNKIVAKPLNSIATAKWFFDNQK